MFKYLIIFAVVLSVNFKFAHGLENKILIKIENEIITTVDIANEISYLRASNKKINTLDQKTLIRIAKNNLIREKIKEIELLKNIKKLEIKKDYLEFLIKNKYLSMGFTNLEEFKIYLKGYDLKINMVIKKTRIDTNWNQFIYAKYKNQIKIDKDSIFNEVKNRKNKTYRLSEILFSLNENEKFEEKYDIIKKSILENGFENTALIHSISDTSSTGGNLGWVSSKAISLNILKKLSKTNMKDYTDPIIVPGGFLILKIQNYKEEDIKYNIEEEVEKVVNSKVNKQLNVFSNLYLNKLKKDIKINEL